MDYRNLLTLCGYSDKEIKEDTPRIEKAFEKAEIGAKEIARGLERLEKFFWTESAGVRKALGIWMKQFVDLALAREEHEKLAFYTYPLEARLGCAINCAGYFAATPEFVIAFVLGYIFGITDSYFEIAEKNGMPPGVGMCGVNKLRLGSFLKGVIPLPDVMIVSSFLCDNEAKTDELFSHHFPGIPRIYLDNCMDSNWDEFPAMFPVISDRRVSYFASETKKCIDELRDLHGIDIKENHIRTARMELAKGFLALQRVIECMKADPAPLSNNDLILFSMMVTNPERRYMAEGLQAIDLVVKDVKKRIDRGEGVVPKGAPKVAWILPWLTDPSINCMVEKTGLSPVISPFFWSHPKDFAKSQYDSFYARSSLSFLRTGLFHSTSGFVFKIKELIKAYNLDGLLWNYSYTCRPVGGHPMIIKKLIEEDPGVPVLALESEWMDSRDSPIGAMRTRLETFADMLKIRRANRTMS
jgi:hypothetical protein